MRIVAAVQDWSRQRCFGSATWEHLAELGEFHWLPEFGTAADVVGESEKSRLVGEAEVLVTAWGTPRITVAVLDRMPKLKLIAHGAGSVAFVDLAAWSRGITVTNVMPIMARGVAEFTVTCILSGLRRLDALLKPALFDSMPYFAVPKVGFALRDRTVGLVGLGIIGRETLRLLRPFGCKFLVYDPYLPAADAEAEGVTLCDLDTLLTQSDVVSLHAPGTAATEKLLNEKRLRLLKPGTVLVNTARGILIDHDALAVVAGEGKIGVYLDVTYPEPLAEGHALRKLSNVVITPHVAGPTVDGWPKMGEACVADIERFIKGGSAAVEYRVTEKQYANQSTS